MSERGFSTTIETALAAQEASLAYLVYLDWPTSVVRVWTGLGSITYGGNTYTGVGTLLTLNAITDGLEKTDTGVELSLNYLDDSLRNAVNANDPIGRAASIYLAVMQPSPLAVTDAYEVFPGYIDGVDIEDDGVSGRIVVRLASELSLMNRSTYYSLSHAHQQALFPGDLGMEFAARMDEPVKWGQAIDALQRLFTRWGQRPPAPPPDYSNPGGG